MQSSGNADSIGSTNKQLLTYLRNIRLHKGDVRGILVAQSASPPAIDSDTISDELRFISEYFNMPIIVIGCNSEHILLDSNASIRKHRELQGNLRSICIDIGASLIYTGTTTHPIHSIQGSSSSSSSSTINSHSLLRRYVVHRLYPELVPMELTIDVSMALSTRMTNL